MLWRRCGTLPPLPAVVVEAVGVRLEMRTGCHESKAEKWFKDIDVSQHMGVAALAFIGVPWLLFGYRLNNSQNNELESHPFSVRVKVRVGLVSA